MHFGRYASRKSEAKYPSLWDGLVGAWCPSVQSPSGNTLYDLSGRNNHGTLNNMDPATDWVRGNGRGALDFDGTNDTVSLPNRSPIVGLFQASFSMWVFIRSLSSNARYFHQWAGSVTNQSWLITTTSGQNAKLTLATANPSSQYRIFGTTNDVLTISQWMHIACTINNATGVYGIWVNGVSAAGTYSLTTNSQPIQVSTTPPTMAGESGVGFFNGAMDDVLMYSRNLQPSEIRLLASQRGIAFTPKRRRVFRQLTNRLRSSRFAAFPA